MGDLGNKIERVNTLVHQANVELYHIWLADIVFKWHWWFELVLLLGSWSIWIFVRKKESTYRLLFAGTLSALIATFLDSIGMAMGLWSYYTKLIPIIPPFILWDFSLIPVTTMLVLQYKPQISPWIKALIVAFVGAYIFEPLYQWIGFYNPKGWKHYYSFPIVFIMYLIANFVATRKQFEKI